MRDKVKAVSLIIAMGIALCLSACSEPGASVNLRETEEPTFRRAKSMLESGDHMEAFNNFKKLIYLRNEDAPESHFEVGLIYLIELDDPISAIYHFSHFKALCEGKNQTTSLRQRLDRVDGLIHTANKKYVVKLKIPSYKDPAERVTLLERIGSLRLENDGLKQRVNQLSGKLDDLATQSYEVPAADLIEVDEEDSTGIYISTTDNSSEVQETVAASRVYVVKTGDTLYKISKDMYGNSSKWQAIYNANRGKIPNQNRLKVGVTLVIP